ETDLPAVLTAGAPVVGAAIGEGGADAPSRAPLPDRQVDLGEPLPDAPVAVSGPDRRERVQRPVAGAGEAARDAPNAELRRVQQAAFSVGRVVELEEVLVAPRETGGDRDRTRSPAVVRDTRHQDLG